jgi:exonuclease SbcD
MPIKIFHTGDLHIGMKFNNYPDAIRVALQQARVDVLKNMLQIANQEQCNLFVIAGDLFHSINGIDKKTILTVASLLESFQGECVLVMPGNHDYDNSQVDLWRTFQGSTSQGSSSQKILLINQEQPYALAGFDVNAVVYPAPCHSKHSETNNLGWIRDAEIDRQLVNIGVAHGSITGISPDMAMNYFNMSRDELEALPMDVWLMGHTHITFPFNTAVNGWKVFNPGTPEPDGLDCKHQGVAWIISISDQKAVSAERVEVGQYQFTDPFYVVNDREDLDAIESQLLTSKPDKTVARIHVSGRVEEDVYQYRQEVFRRIEDRLGHLIIDDSGLGIKITPEKIQREFSDGSFPQRLLSTLSDDEEALQMAYELVAEVRI